MDAPKEDQKGGIDSGTKSPEEIELLEQIRRVNDEKHRLEAECIALDRLGRVDECARKRRAVEEARRYLKMLCGKHRKKFYKRYFRSL